MATTIKLDDELKDRVHRLAGLRDRSAHWIMREAITQYVEREERRETFKQDAMRTEGCKRRTSSRAGDTRRREAARASAARWPPCR
jgi:predicted DNA-binding protein